jgi:hypothetical protein
MVQTMKTKSIALIAILIATVIGWMFWPHGSITMPPPGSAPSSPPADYKTASYTIGGETVALVNGYAESSIVPGSASKLVTRYFGNAATGDLTGNGTNDVAFIVTQSGGGSGTFYYVVAVLRTPKGYQGTNAVLLGDRIAPQTTQIKNREIIVNYAERKPTDPMTVQPSVGVTKYLQVQSGTLVEVK